MVEDCKTNCDARAHFDATCTQPSLTVTAGYTGTAAQQPRLQRLVGALQNNYTRLLNVGYRAVHVVKNATAGYSVALDGVTTTANQVGLGAAACVADAITQVAGAAAKVDVSVNVSVSFSASVSAGGSAAAM